VLHFEFSILPCRAVMMGGNKQVVYRADCNNKSSRVAHVLAYEIGIGCFYHPKIPRRSVFLLVGFFIKKKTRSREVVRDRDERYYYYYYYYYYGLVINSTECCDPLDPAN
jgi:hypothetical protein